jgi:hypothetical protein
MRLRFGFSFKAQAIADPFGAVDLDFRRVGFLRRLFWRIHVLAPVEVTGMAPCDLRCVKPMLYR